MAPVKRPFGQWWFEQYKFCFDNKQHDLPGLLPTPMYKGDTVCKLKVWTLLISGWMNICFVKTWWLIIMKDIGFANTQVEFHNTNNVDLTTAHPGLYQCGDIRVGTFGMWWGLTTIDVHQWVVFFTTCQVRVARWALPVQLLVNIGWTLSVQWFLTRTRMDQNELASSKKRR